MTTCYICPNLSKPDCLVCNICSKDSTKTVEFRDVFDKFKLTFKEFQWYPPTRLYPNKSLHKNLFLVSHILVILERCVKNDITRKSFLDDCKKKYNIFSHLCLKCENLSESELCNKCDKMDLTVTPKFFLQKFSIDLKSKIKPVIKNKYLILDIFDYMEDNYLNPDNYINYKKEWEDILTSDQKRIYTAIEISRLFLQKKGINLRRRNLFKICDSFKYVRDKNISVMDYSNVIISNSSRLC